MIFLCILLGGCTIQLHPVVIEHEEERRAAASTRIMVPQSGQTFGAESILGLSLVHDTRSDRENTQPELKFRVRSAVNAFVHCYHRSATGRINRILPSKAYVKTRFSAGQTMTFSVEPRERFSTDLRHDTETLMCLAAEEELIETLTLHTSNGETESNLDNTEFDRLFTLYRQSTDRNLVARSLGIPR